MDIAKLGLIALYHLQIELLGLVPPALVPISRR